jgi:protein-tyrosine phosphatase
MLQIFTKKLFITDLLDDFVDIHNHILPGIDDGAKNIQESLNLINKLKDLGIKQFIPTPHIMQDFYPNTDETIADAYQLLLGSLSNELQKNITINPAAEYMLDNNFEKLVDQENLFTLKRNYVLIELSYFQPPINLENLIFKLKTKGYQPVLAHPERYTYYHNNLAYYSRLKSLGCLFQLNVLALSDHYGKSVQKTAHYLINENLIDFTGTDTHNEGHIEKLKNINSSKKMIMPLKKIIEHTKATFSVI